MAAAAAAAGKWSGAATVYVYALFSLRSVLRPEYNVDFTLFILLFIYFFLYLLISFFVWLLEVLVTPLKKMLLFYLSMSVCLKVNSPQKFSKLYYAGDMTIKVMAVAHIMQKDRRGKGNPENRYGGAADQEVPAPRYTPNRGTEERVEG